MKKIFLFLILCPIFNISFSQNPVVYCNFVSHNEDNYTQYLSNINTYLTARTNLRQFAITCKQKGAKWSMGNDFVMLDAILMHDTGPVTSNTGGLNLLKWLQDSMDVECDPHAHAKSFAYQDVAYKHTLLGVTPSSVVSGFLYQQTDDSGYWWSDFENPIQSTLDTSYYWHPEILWGAAVPGHSTDPLYHGVWKPKDTTDFFIHNAANRMILYGSGCRIGIYDTTTVTQVLASIDSVLASIEVGTYPQNGFYPMSIFMRESDLTTPSFLLKLSVITDSINNRVAAGKMEWKHIEDIISLWKSNFAEVPFYVSCDGQTILSDEKLEEKTSNFQLYPNPAQNLIIVEAEPASSKYLIILTDLTGKELISQANLQGETPLNLENLPSGIYIIKIQSATFRKAYKIIKK